MQYDLYENTVSFAYIKYSLEKILLFYRLSDCLSIVEANGMIFNSVIPHFQNR